MSAAAIAQRWGVAGHDGAVSDLAAQVASGQVAHAYLLTGPEGVGRTTLALALARALNCEAAPDERPCNECPNCRRLLNRAHPDVTLVDLEWQRIMVGGPRGDRSRERQRLSIDAVRWLRQDIVTRPVLGRWKVQIVDDADLFSDVAPDAFLKTLEEPPPFAVIVLIAARPDRVPETIRSRCRALALGAVGRAAIVAALEERGTAPETSATIARLARGRMADALTFAADPDALLRRREQVEEAFEQLVTPLGRVTITGAWLKKHSGNRDQLAAALNLWIGLWRDALLHRAGLSDDTAFPEVQDRLAPYAARRDVPDLYRALWATRRCLNDLDANMQARIALQAMVMQWPA
jgi:DNA polymerase-3 subunit delta'